jgi:hypothetical protein
MLENILVNLRLEYRCPRRLVARPLLGSISHVISYLRRLTDVHLMHICKFGFFRFKPVSLVIINGLVLFWTVFSTKLRVLYRYTSFLISHFLSNKHSSKDHEDNPNIMIYRT